MPAREARRARVSRRARLSIASSSVSAASSRARPTTRSASKPRPEPSSLQLLADPVRGADEPNSRLAFLDDRTRQYIRTLVDQNNRTEAQRVLLD